MTGPCRAAFCALLLTGCQTMTEAPAVLTATSKAEAAALVAKALGRSSVALGEPDPRKASRVVVLPPRPGPRAPRSVAVPTVYDLVLTGGTCALVLQESGERFVLPEGACRPA